VGVIAAVHIGMTLLGVKGMIIAGACIDLALAVTLLGFAPARLRLAYATGALAVSAVVVLYAGFGVRLDPHHMASGVYRHGTLITPDKYDLLRYEDGKTSTVSVTRFEGTYSLRNNGKSDGSMNSVPGGAPTGDQATMALLGALPVMMMPDARRIANIGFGTGLTAHALLASDRLEILDTIEIEPAVIEAARAFMPFNARAFEDPRSRVHIEDAKTFFSSHQARYDVIVSEPSNPWVSGVAGLFSAEFYRHVRRHLREGGLFVQWVQLYEFSPQLLASVIQALGPVFSDYVIWLANDGDMIIVAANGGSVPAPSAAAFRNREMAALLAPFQIRGLDDLNLHRVGGKKTMDVYFQSFGAEANSDFFPIIDLNAAKARFMRANATGTVRLTEGALPLLDLFEPGNMPDASRVTAGPRTGGMLRPVFATQALTAREYLLSGDPRVLEKMAPEPAGELAMLRAAMIDCKIDVRRGTLGASLDRLSRLINVGLPKHLATGVWDKLSGSRCRSKLDADEARWLELFAAIGARSPERIAAHAEAVLAEEKDLSADSRAYALAALMAGRVLSGDRGAALKAFNTHRGRLKPAVAWQPTFTFLSAHALGPMVGGASPRGDNY
jgi:SAM-dependent methyltransferase